MTMDEIDKKKSILKIKIKRMMTKSEIKTK